MATQADVRRIALSQPETAETEGPRRRSHLSESSTNSGVEMREVPDQPINAWQPPAYSVDSNGKVQGVAPGTPNNWGRWGDEDQRGTSNLCSDERVAAAAALIRTGKRFALGLPIGIPTPGYRQSPQHFMAMGAGDGVLGDGNERIQMSDDYVVLALQASTQLDGLAHVGANGALYNGYWSGLVTARSHARRVGVHHQANGVVGRGVLLDVARHSGQDALPAGFAIGPDELDATAAAQGVVVQPGDAVLVRTGCLGAAMAKGGARPAGGEPGLSARAVPWLHDHDAALVATDTMTCEVVPADTGTQLLDFHVGAIRDLGLQVCELYDLDALADDCASDGVYEFFFACMPLPVVNGVGSPINPLAIK